MKHIIHSVLVMVVFIVVLGLIYPFFTFLAGQLLFKDKANGSLIHKEGKIIGSSLIGQNFSSAKYFHSRPSANNYNAMKSGSSNFPISYPEFKDKVKEREADYRKTNNVHNKNIPVDAITESASGLDPHISPKNAYLQAERISKQRNIPLTQIKALIDNLTEKPSFFFIGNSRVNVLKLNIALDDLSNRQK